MVVTYRDYAYPNGGGGSGADGIVTIFSDANVAPVAGGSGGSLGYAQYKVPPIPQVLQGVVGGWHRRIWKLFQPNGKPLSGPGLTVNSVSIRGPANSFYTQTCQSIRQRLSLLGWHDGVGAHHWVDRFDCIGRRSGILVPHHH